MPERRIIFLDDDDEPRGGTVASCAPGPNAPTSRNRQNTRNDASGTNLPPNKMLVLLQHLPSARTQSVPRRQKMLLAENLSNLREIPEKISAASRSKKKIVRLHLSSLGETWRTVWPTQA